MVSDWVALGLPYQDFWPLSLREIALVSDALRKREVRAVERERMLNQERAHLAAFAFHQPDKIPDLVKEAQKRASPEEHGAADMRAALLNWKLQLDLQCQQ